MRRFPHPLLLGIAAAGMTSLAAGPASAGPLTWNFGTEAAQQGSIISPAPAAGNEKLIGTGVWNFSQGGMTVGASTVSSLTNFPVLTQRNLTFAESGLGVYSGRRDFGTTYEINIDEGLVLDERDVLAKGAKVTSLTVGSGTEGRGLQRPRLQRRDALLQPRDLHRDPEQPRVLRLCRDHAVQVFRTHLGGDRRSAGSAGDSDGSGARQHGAARRRCARPRNGPPPPRLTSGRGMV